MAEAKFDKGELPVESLPISWDDMIIGEEFGPIDYTVKESTHEKHTEHLGMKHPWYVTKSPWGRPLLYPWEVWSGARVLSRCKYGRINQNVLAGFRWEFCKPATVGQKLFGRAQILTKYKKRGKNYWEYESVTTDENGDVIFKAIDRDVTLAGWQGKLHP